MGWTGKEFRNGSRPRLRVGHERLAQMIPVISLAAVLPLVAPRLAENGVQGDLDELFCSDAGLPPVDQADAAPAPVFVGLPVNTTPVNTMPVAAMPLSTAGDVTPSVAKPEVGFVTFAKDALVVVADPAEPGPDLAKEVVPIAEAVPARPAQLPVAMPDLSQLSEIAGKTPQADDEAIPDDALARSKHLPLHGPDVAKADLVASPLPADGLPMADAPAPGRGAQVQVGPEIPAGMIVSDDTGQIARGSRRLPHGAAGFSAAGQILPNVPLAEHLVQPLKADPAPESPLLQTGGNLPQRIVAPGMPSRRMKDDVSTPPFAPSAPAPQSETAAPVVAADDLRAARHPLPEPETTGAAGVPERAVLAGPTPPEAVVQADRAALPAEREGGVPAQVGLADIRPPDRIFDAKPLDHRGAPMPPTVAAALVQQAQAVPDGPVTVTLSPEDLGQVRFEMHGKGEAIHISLTVERPETLDLLRRHADQLVSEFRQAGFSGASFSFSGAMTGGQGRETAQPYRQQPAEDVADAQSMHGYRLSSGSTGLDLRV